MDPTRFDDLAKRLATTSLSRRRVLFGLGGGLVGTVLAGGSWQAAGAASGGNSACAPFCTATFPPGPDRGQCISDAAQGTGACYLCGPAAPPAGCCTNDDCPAPATCGGGGTPNICGCTPTTCEALGATCGAFGDGCGSTLNCGGCNQCETCSPQGSCQAMGTACGDSCCAGDTPTCCDGICIGAGACCHTSDCSEACATCDPATHQCVVCASGGTCIENQCCATPCGTSANQICCAATQSCDSTGTCCTSASNACTTDSDCCSGACVGEICQPTCGEEDAPCDDAGDCCDGWTCVTAEGGTGVCCATGVACAGSCCVSSTAICTSDGCCTPESADTTCTGKCGTVPNNCGQNVACGGCDVSNCMGCDPDSHTCIATCGGGGCIAGSGTCCSGGPGTFCCQVSQYGCGAGYTGPSRDCCSGWCQDGECCVPTGQSCTANIECCSGQCQGAGGEEFGTCA